MLFFLLNMLPLPFLFLKTIVINKKVAKENLRPTIPGFCPQELADLITWCWEDDPDKRPGFDEILDYLHDLQMQVNRFSFC